GRFSPGGRYFAMLDLKQPGILVDDLVSQQRTTVPVRFHQRGTGITQLAWIDDTQFLINGNATSDIAANLWRLRIDREGHLVGPPEVWVASERDTAIVLDDVHGERILLTRTRIAPRSFVLDGPTRTALLSSGLLLYPNDVDRR